MRGLAPRLSHHPFGSARCGDPVPEPPSHLRIAALAIPLRNKEEKSKRVLCVLGVDTFRSPSLVFLSVKQMTPSVCLMPPLVSPQGGLSAAPARAVSAVKNINLPEIPRNINIGDLNIKVPNLSQFV